MGVVGEFLSAVPVWVIPAVLGPVLCIFVVLFVIGFRQGRAVSLWPPRIGSRPAPKDGEPPAAAPPASETSQHVEPHHLPQIDDRFVPDDGWRRNAVVDHDRLFGADRLIGLVTTAVSSPSAN